MRPETFRKALILVAMGLSNFTEAYLMSNTACLVAGLFQEKDDLQFTDDDISWIMSIMYTSMVFGVLLATYITEKIGRRITVVVFMVPVFIHYIMLYYARNFYVFIVARLLAGLGFGGALPMIYMVMAECSSPKMRGFNLAIIISVLPSIGAAFGGNIGIILNWRVSALIGAVPTLLSSILPFFCVESPPWLASKGRFDECEAAFTSLHGLKPAAQKELQLILEVEKAKFNNSDKSTHTMKIILVRLKFAATKWYFWKIMFITNVITFYKMIVGRILYGSYGIIILQKLSGQSDILPYTLAISGISIVGSPFTGILMKKINVRSLLLPSGLVNCLLLIGLSVSLYIVPDNYDSPILVWTNVLLYIVHSSLVAIILFPISEALPSELYPLEIRGACNTIVAFIGTGFIFFVLKVTPAMFLLVGIKGIFLIYALAMLVLLLYIWMQLPETKGRTLHEIELKLKNEKHVQQMEEFDCSKQTKELI